MKTIGLIGGMRWESTVLYYRAINRAVGARLGGLHSARLLLYSVDFAEIEDMLREERAKRGYVDRDCERLQGAQQFARHETRPQLYDNRFGPAPARHKRQRAVDDELVRLRHLLELEFSPKRGDAFVHGPDRRKVRPKEIASGFWGKQVQRNSIHRG